MAKVKKFGYYRERTDFSKIKSEFELGNLLEIQRESFNWFLEDGIKEVFDDIFPIESFSGALTLEFGEYYFDIPRYSIKETKDRESTYAAPLKVKARLFNNETGAVKEQEIFLGDMPIMTDACSFVVNGAERVIVSQLVRSPSAYYSSVIDKNGRIVNSAQLIPSRGTWLEYEIDARDILYVKIDRTRKLPITTFIRAFGLSSDEQILEFFGESTNLINTIAKDSTANTDEALIEIYEKLRPGEPATLDSAKNQLMVRFFDKFRYDLAKVGRYKFNKKLNVLERLLNQTIAEDIIVDGELLVEKGTLITKDIQASLEDVFKNGYNLKEFIINEDLDEYNKIQEVLIYDPKNSERTIKIIGNDPTIEEKRLTTSDIYASISYYLNLMEGVGTIDEIDHLANRRVKQVGELLQNQFRIGITRMERVIKERMTTQDIEAITPKTLINIRPITAAIKEFFGSSQLSQFMDQINPMSELTHKRRLSALGPGGLSRDRAGVEVRDVNASHYGRICPIESPEGPNIGLITSLSTHAVVDEYGFIKTPYRRVVDKVLTDDVVYMTADEESDYIISQAAVTTDENNMILDEKVLARKNGENILANTEDIDFTDVSAQQLIAATSGCIPFLEHDDVTRALMGANMQRQAVPLLKAEAPIVATGMECSVAKDGGSTILSKAAGVVEYVDAKKIIIKNAKAKDVYYLTNFERTNADTCFNHSPVVKTGDKVVQGQVLADGPSIELGESALGKNLTVAFMTYNGYNYEDAIILNERLVRDDVLTSVHIKASKIECRDTKLGPEEFTRDIPNVSEDARKNLDEFGIIRIGTEVKEGDILVGKVTPKGMVELTSEEKLLHAIFGEKTREVRDTSLKVPHGGGGIVHDVKIFTRKDNDELPAGVSQVVRIYILQKRKISVGDKLAGRHGNKGVVSLILPSEDMPYLPDGTPVDVMLNPQGVPSRMNIGQVLELHLGMAAKKLGIHVANPVFDGANNQEIIEYMEKAGMAPDGKTELYDGRTGRKFDNRVSVGVMYMIKLYHMIDDKLHARSTGPYSLVTQQPLGGKAQFGGQRFGEMEVWALYAYGAANILHELITVKSDDVVGRVKMYESIVKGNQLTKPGIPESFRVLVKEFQALGLDITARNSLEQEIKIENIDSNDSATSIEEVENEIATKVSDELEQEQKEIDTTDISEDEFDFEDDDFESDEVDFEDNGIEIDDDEDFEAVEFEGSDF